jgi:hypothetical protein
MSVNMKMAAFWVVVLGNLMETASMFEMSVNFYQTVQHNNPGNSHLHTRCCENLTDTQAHSHPKCCRVLVCRGSTKV